MTVMFKVISIYHVFDLSIHSLAKLMNFICVAAVSHGIYQMVCEICQILPQETVGPNF